MNKMKLVFLTLVTFQCYAQTFPELPVSFGDKAYDHIINICDFGTRSPGSIAENYTMEYLKEKFSEIDMQVEIDTFYYNWLNLKNRQIILNDTYLPMQTCYVNESFRDTMDLTAECYVLDKPLFPPSGIKNKIVLSNESNHVILLKEYAPKAIIVFNKDIFPGLIQYHNKTIEIHIPAEIRSERKASYNLIATYKSISTKERKDIILTAHWDSQNGSGADDNASGISVLIELAGYFRPYADTLAYDFKFVTTGAEEVGLIGSKSYVLKYSDDLKNCLLNINIDGVGNGKKPYIEMRKQIDFNEYDTSPDIELISTDNFRSNLYTSFLEIYRNSSSPEIYPEWLTNDILSAMKKLNYRYSKAACCSGADHRSFAYLNIPVAYLTIISGGKNKLRHTPRDIPDVIFINNLDKAGSIVRNIIIQICTDEELTNL